MLLLLVYALLFSVTYQRRNRTTNIHSSRLDSHEFVHIKELSSCLPKALLCSDVFLYAMRATRFRFDNSRLCMLSVFACSFFFSRSLSRFCVRIFRLCSGARCIPNDNTTWKCHPTKMLYGISLMSRHSGILFRESNTHRVIPIISLKTGIDT